MNTKLRERFEAKLNKDADGCWLWSACCNRAGYGVFSVGGHARLAHRVAYYLYIGAIPDGFHVCHTCDTPVCVRPDHLWLGTDAENLRDMVVNGRSAKGDKNGTYTHPESRPRGDAHWTHLYPERMNSARGEQHFRAKLSTDDVLAIRAAVGFTQRQLASQHGVSHAQINGILSGKFWAHLLPAV